MSIPQLEAKARSRRLDVLVGRTVRDLMEDNGEEQADVARLLGVDQSVVSKKLRGAVKFSPYELYRLAEHYGVSMDKLYRRARDEDALPPLARPEGLEPPTFCSVADTVPFVPSAAARRGIRRARRGAKH